MWHTYAAKDRCKVEGWYTICLYAADIWTENQAMS